MIVKYNQEEHEKLLQQKGETFEKQRTSLHHTYMHYNKRV